MRGLLHKTELGWQIQYIKRVVTHDSAEAIRCVNLPVHLADTSLNNELLLKSKENELVDFEIIELTCDGSPIVARIVENKFNVFDYSHAGVNKMGTGPGARKVRESIIYKEDDVKKATLMGELSALLRLRLSVQNENEISHHGQFIKIADYIDRKTSEAKKLGWL